MSRNKVFTRRELIAEVAGRVNLSQADVARVYEATSEVQLRQLRSGAVVRTQNGQIKIVSRKARRGINPRTGARITIPACRRPRFVFSKNFRENF